MRYITNNRSSQSWRDLDLSLANAPNPSRESWRDLDLSVGVSRPMTEAEIAKSLIANRISPPDSPQT